MNTVMKMSIRKSDNLLNYSTSRIGYLLFSVGKTSIGCSEALASGKNGRFRSRFTDDLPGLQGFDQIDAAFT